METNRPETLQLRNILTLHPILYLVCILHILDRIGALLAQPFLWHQGHSVTNIMAAAAVDWDAIKDKHISGYTSLCTPAKSHQRHRRASDGGPDEAGASHLKKACSLFCCVMSCHTRALAHERCSRKQTAFAAPPPAFPQLVVHKHSPSSMVLGRLHVTTAC